MTRGEIDRRRVSVQWFSGTILTGLCGAALMGGAVFAALDGQTNFATVPERVELALRGAVWQPGRSPRHHAQEQSAAARRRIEHPPPGHPGEHHHSRGQPRARAGTSVRARGRATSQCR